MSATTAEAIAKSGVQAGVWVVSLALLALLVDDGAEGLGGAHLAR